MRLFKGAKGQRMEQKNLDGDILKLVKEQYRLMGKVVYEPLDPELEKLIKGKE